MKGHFHVLRQHVRQWPASHTLLGVALACVLFSIFMRLSGRSAWQMWSDIISGGLGNRYAMADSLLKAIPILFCALAASGPARAGLINIGGEGQLLVGGIAASVVALGLASWPRPVVLTIMCIAGLLAGGLWGAFPGFLKTTVKASETIASLLMNFIALLFLQYLIHGLMKDSLSRGWAQSAPFGPSAVLPTLMGRVHLLLLIAFLATGVLWVVTRYTTWGVALRVIRGSPSVAAYAGISSGRYYVMTMLFGGAMAGLAGVGEVSVVQGRLREGLSLGYGYSGFLVAWLCADRILMLPLAAVLFGAMVTGCDSLQVASGLPFSTGMILQGMVLLSVIACQRMLGITDEPLITASGEA
jgi:simple sugar transport system permease protein